MMKVVAVKNFEEMSQLAAAMISHQVKEEPNSVLGLATGGTVVGTYKELIKDHEQNHTSYENIHTVNLDEYLGIDKNHPNSYYHFMMENLFPISILIKIIPIFQTGWQIIMKRKAKNMNRSFQI